MLSILNKLLGILLLRRTMSASTSLLESVLMGAATIFTLGLVCMVLVSSLITGGIYVSYNALVAHGVDSIRAAVLVGGSIFTLLVVILIVLAMSIRRIGRLPRHFATTESELTRSVNQVLDSFLAGFEGKPATNKPTSK